MNAHPSRALRRIGILDMASPDADRLAYWDLFKRSLHELGHVEGEEVALEFRWADGLRERMVSVAAALVASRIDVLVTAGTPAAAAAMEATADIPIIMATGVILGTRLSDGARKKPDKTPDNVTGISDLPPGVSARRLELLREALDRSAPLAILADRANPSSELAVRETRDAGRSLGMRVADYWLEGPVGLRAVLSQIARDGVGGFIIAPGAMFFAKRAALAALAREYRLPSMSVRREYAEAGCLMAYGASLRENYRRAAIYVSRVLDGAKPVDLAIDQPTEFDFVVNLATAKAIGLALPRALLASAETLETASAIRLPPRSSTQPGNQT